MDKRINEKPKNIPYEDTALKLAMEFFGEELLPYFGIKGIAKCSLPTEEVDIELLRKLEDYNFLMESPNKGEEQWIAHFEFQSRDEKIPGLRRFRLYEALKSNRYGLPVVTYVLYSGKVKNPVIQFTEGLNTYRIHPIIMQEENADELFEKLTKKKLTKKDMVPVLLSPLMSGKMSIKDRIITSYHVLDENSEALQVDEQDKMRSVIYAMASKFLDKKELDDVKEVVKMTKLGQLLVEDGIAEGKIVGKIEERKILVEKMLRKGYKIDEIEDLVEEDEEFIQKVKENM